MSQQIISLGAAANDGTGSVLRDGGQAINQNFTELYKQASDANAAIAALQARQNYAPLAISSFTATPVTIERTNGSTNVDLAWTISGSGPVTGQTLTDSVSGNVPLTNSVADRAKTISVNSSRSETLAVSNSGAPGGADNVTRSVDIQVLPRRFWGVADAAALVSADVVALTSELSAARAKKFTVDAGGGGGKFVYYAYLAELGSQAAYKLFGYDDDPVVSTVSVTTTAGLTANYFVLRSANKLAGSVPAEIG